MAKKTDRPPPRFVSGASAREPRTRAAIERERQLTLWREVMNRYQPSEPVELRFEMQIGNVHWAGPYVPKGVIASLLGVKRLAARRRRNPYARDRRTQY